MAEKFSVMQGLFGMNPAQAARGAFDQAYDEELGRQAQIAQLDPWQATRMFSGQAGNMLGRAGARLVGGMLGADIEEPTVKRARIVQEAIQGLAPEELSDPRVFGPRIIQAFQENGLSNEAVMLGQELEAQGLARAKTIADISKARNESSPFGKINPKDFTPASLAKFRQTGDFNDLEADPSSKAAPIIAMERFNAKLADMKAKGIFVEDLDPYEQAELYANASAAIGAEAAAGFMPTFAKGKSLTVEEQKRVGLASEMARAEPVVMSLENSGWKFSGALAQMLSAPSMKDSNLPVIDFLKVKGVPDSDLRAMDAYLNYLGPALYQKTGAAVTVSEFMRMMRGYLPWEWDNEASLGHKQDIRRAQLIGTEQAFTAAGLDAYNAARERLGLPPSDRVIAGPLSKSTGAPRRAPLSTAPINEPPKPNKVPRGTTTVSGTVKPAPSSGAAATIRSAPVGSQEWSKAWDSMTPSEREEYVRERTGR